MDPLTEALRTSSRIDGIPPKEGKAKNRKNIKLLSDMAAKKSFDYSKWDKIELSDDESDLHPNIDKESWFRMKHRSRLEREEREDEEIKQYEGLNKENNARLQVINARYISSHSLTDSIITNVLPDQIKGIAVRISRRGCRIRRY